MGRSYRERPKRLGRKLALIRQRLGLTQPELIVRLGVKGEPLYPSSITLYEQGKREPPLLVLLRYARLADVTMESLVDDKLKLPD
ncbi:MAG TPA: helix-turn-helix transcriptional regulator [Pyrinomonadaceae bacterium]|nr:helix-turn-helix transcriptional regulator [Pyrinomonadaceae bacterium]